MQKNSLWKRDDSILRVLDERENEMLVIDCIHPVMPMWIRKDELLGYIRDFRLWTSSAADGLTVEISAVNGRFTLDFLQTFSNPLFVNAFLKELEENGIVYDLQDVNELELANIKLPWTE